MYITVLLDQIGRIHSNRLSGVKRIKSKLFLAIRNTLIVTQPAILLASELAAHTVTDWTRSNRHSDLSVGAAVPVSGVITARPRPTDDQLQCVSTVRTSSTQHAGYCGQPRMRDRKTLSGRQWQLGLCVTNTCDAADMRGRKRAALKRHQRRCSLLRTLADD